MSGPDRIVKEEERRSITGLSRTTAYRLERAGKFPRRVVIHGELHGWYMSELQAWIAGRERVVLKQSEERGVTQ